VPGLTASLADFVATLDPERVPGEAARTVQRGLVDCFGVLFAGREEPVVQLARSLVAQPGEGPARILGDGARCSAPDAALVDAVASHALDYDDTGLDGHPSAILVPVVIAQSARVGASGAASIAAYVAGYETWAELVSREADSHHSKGWHPTAVFGTVAAAAAAASLARLDAARVMHALGIAASMAAGIVANFGSMTKPLQVGFAARNGLLAVELAARGATAAHDALEHPRGFLAAISPAGRVRLDGPMQQDAWRIVERGLSIKRYPVCYAAHRAVDAAMAMRERLDERVADIERIEVELGRVQASMLRSHAPTNASDAKFSVEFAVAAALVLGRLGLAELGDETVNEPRIRALAARVQVRPLDQRDPEDPLFAPFDRLHATMCDGATISSLPVRRAKGHATLPLADEELRQKFFDCAGRALGEDQAALWWSALARFGDGGVRSLPSAAAPSR
jgi:2-methylcitrate dehydratase PrpD